MVVKGDNGRQGLTVSETLDGRAPSFPLAGKVAALAAGWG